MLVDEGIKRGHEGGDSDTTAVPTRAMVLSRRQDYSSISETVGSFWFSQCCLTGKVLLVGRTWRPGWKLGTEHPYKKKKYHIQDANKAFI